jgi:guanylate kinase
MSQAQHFDYLVVNQDFDTAIQDFVAIVRTARLQKTVQLQQPAVQALVHFDG